MPDRSGFEVSESVAEGVRAALALTAVVLVVRHQAGALGVSPAPWGAWFLCGITWAAALVAAHGTRSEQTIPLSRWRDCVAPALLTLIVGGGSNATSLVITTLVLLAGVAVVCLVDFRRFSEAAASVAAPQNAPESVTPDSRESASTEMPATAWSPPRSSFAVDPSPPASLSNPLRFDSQETPPGPSRISESPPATSDEQAESVMRVEREPESIILTEIPIEEETSTDSIAESWTRVETDGGVSIEAVVHARFAAGAKSVVIHLPFMPPLPFPPEIECEPLDSGCELTIIPEVVQRHGARLSVMRRSHGEAESLPIGVVIYTNANDEIE